MLQRSNSASEGLSEEDPADGNPDLDRGTEQKLDGKTNAEGVVRVIHFKSLIIVHSMCCCYYYDNVLFFLLI